MNEEITIESALEELRSLTDHRFDVTFRSVGWIEVAIWADKIIPTAVFKTRRSTLSDVMAEVRAWKAQQAS